MKTTFLLAALLATSVTAFAADQAPNASRAAPLTKAAFLAHAGQKFDAADVNHDGVLSVAEQTAVHHKAVGPLTRAAFLANAASRFDEADTNHDGVLTREEITAFRNKQRANAGK